MNLWTMVAEKRRNRTRYHIATETFIPYCGKRNMLVRDYVRYQNGRIDKVGESFQILETISEGWICKKCMKSLKKSINTKTLED